MKPLLSLLLALVVTTAAGAQDWTFVASDYLSKAHKAMGYITPSLGLATYLSMQGEGEDDASSGHKFLGRATGIAAGTTVALGLLAHWDRLAWPTVEEPLTLDDLHAVLATLGATALMIAALQGGHDGHDAYGEAGTALMGVSILFEW